MKVNIRKLKRELYYHPAWEEDKHMFMQLLYQSYFSDQDIITLGRLYVKYSHIHCFQKSELTIYFSYMLEKMQIHSSKELFSRTHNIYRKVRHSK